MDADTQTMSARSRDSRTHAPSSCTHSVIEQRGHFEVWQWQVPVRSNSNYVWRTAHSRRVARLGLSVRVRV